MRVSYEQRTGSFYLYLSENGENHVVAKTYPCDPREVGGLVNLDMDRDGRLIGIEILGGASLLRSSVVESLLKPKGVIEIESKVDR